ncbi:MAG: RNA-binding domain-containing protein [Chloroflexota bacterium]
MNLSELRQRIETWENLHTEFKEWPTHEDDLSAALVAFGNTDGGQLIIGVANNRQIKGVKNADKAMQRLDQIAYNNCEPPLTIVQETVTTEDGAIVVVVNIPKGDQRPYRTNRGDYFIRTTSGRRRASRQELLRLFQNAESLYYDETLVMRAALADLDRWAFEQYIQRAYLRPLEQLGINYEDLLRNLGYVREQNGSLYPTMACMLFFGREPQRFFPHAHVVAARIPGVDFSAPPSDNKQISGPAAAMLEDAVRFLRIHLRTAHRIQAFEPEAYPELPEEALREVLVNALAHRDYTIAAPIRVFVFDDRVEVRTPGGLPNTVTVEAIRLGAVHVLRNPTIYMLFSRQGMVTGIGTGVYRAIQQVRELTHREPALFLEGNEFVVSLPRSFL